MTTCRVVSLPMVIEAARYRALRPEAVRRIGEHMTPASRPADESASTKITARIRELGDWRGETLAHLRRLIHDADPDAEEEWKWEKPTSGGTRVWSHDGCVCTGEPYKQDEKLT